MLLTDIDVDINGDGEFSAAEDLAEGMPPGRLIPVNRDDDNTNGVDDCGDSAVDTNENDLVEIRLTIGPTNLDVGTVVLKITEGVTNINIWTSEHKGSSNLLIGAAASASTNWEVGASGDIADLGAFPYTNLWIEGLTNSSSNGDVEIVFSYEDTDGVCRSADTCLVTVVRLVLHPKPEDFAGGHEGRIMISTRHDDVYYATNRTTKADAGAQTNDATVTVTAHLLPTSLVGQVVYFRAVDPDPDDLSSYETNSLGGDNRDGGVSNGILSASSDVVQIATINGTNVAAAEVEITITDRYAGDSFVLDCSPHPSFIPSFGRSATLTAWKRIYVEQDAMYRIGADLISDVTAGDNYVELTEAGVYRFNIGDSVVVFDADHPDGENATVSNILYIGSYRLILDCTLTNSYLEGDEYYLGERGAAVANATGGVFDADTACITNAFGYGVEGLDGGAFVEFAYPPGGAGSIPYRRQFDDDTDLTIFSRLWFENRGKTNYLQLCGGAHLSGYGDSVMGGSLPDENMSYVFLEEIEIMAASPADETARSQDTTPHEIAHQFGLDTGDFSHVDLFSTNAGYSVSTNHEGSGRCLMDYEHVSTNTPAEFCTNCLYTVRDEEDEL